MDFLGSRWTISDIIHVLTALSSHTTTQRERNAAHTAYPLLVLVIAVAALCGCKAEASHARSATRRAGSDGCRSPREAGCSNCCEQRWLEDPSDHELRLPSCRVRSHAPNPADQQNRDLVYNRTDGFSGRCSPQCAPCADCTEDEERAYRRIEALGCDCLAPQPASLDPCFGGGCACLCSQFTPLAACRAYDPASGLRH